ncbi:uncharacterized protein [Ranitomeya imitator]|uniref:uncharacterized protein n=1 Tax=Ranitomeya imitator TaxID=111125 RepID=UPI0037E9676B
MSLSDVPAIVAAALLLEAQNQLEAEARNNRAKRQRRMWTRQWLQKRNQLSHMGLIRELKENNPHDFKNYLRMSEDSFNFLLEAVEPYIRRQNTRMRAAVPVDERLAVTLRFLATGRSMQDLHYCAAISRTLLSVIIPETCKAIISALHQNYMPFPETPDDWKEISRGFHEQWQFPNCGGALDGKHVRITQPPHSGSFYYNYKGYFSVIVMALVNANYEFVSVSVGINGRLSDGGVLELTDFGDRLKENKLALPPNSDTTENMNFVFVGDEAFPLHPNLLKPFSQKTLTPERRIFNYRLSRARRVVENAFGIMANRFRVFHTAMNMKLSSIDSVVLACCVLHNFLRRRDATAYSPPQYVDSVDPANGDITQGEWRLDNHRVSGLESLGSGRNNDDATNCREKYCDFFNGPGAVSWQHQQL